MIVYTWPRDSWCAHHSLSRSSLIGILYDLSISDIIPTYNPRKRHMELAFGFAAAAASTAVFQQPSLKCVSLRNPLYTAGKGRFRPRVPCRGCNTLRMTNGEARARNERHGKDDIHNNNFSPMRNGRDGLTERGEKSFDTVLHELVHGSEGESKVEEIRISRNSEFELSEPPMEEKVSGGRVGTMEREGEKSFDTVLQELVAIQQDGPRNVAILGTRYTSYLHQQIIELLTYANVLVGNHVFTSGAPGTNAAVIKGALRAEKPDLLTVVLPQSLGRQPGETQDQLRKVSNLIEMKKNDTLPLDIASQLCNSDILSRVSHFIAFAFHDSDVVYV